jgi:type VI secretion system secreted protein VgrG
MQPTAAQEVISGFVQQGRPRMSNPNEKPGQQNQTPGQKPGQQQQGGGQQKPGQQQQPNPNPQR